MNHINYQVHVGLYSFSLVFGDFVADQSTVGTRKPNRRRNEDAPLINAIRKWGPIQLLGVRRRVKLACSRCFRGSRSFRCVFWGFLGFGKCLEDCYPPMFTMVLRAFGLLSGPILWCRTTKGRSLLIFWVKNNSGSKGAASEDVSMNYQIFEFLFQTLERCCFQAFSH